jgi:hypothetical protein
MDEINQQGDPGHRDGGEKGEKAIREGALEKGLHLSPNQPPENAALPVVDTGGEGGGGEATPSNSTSDGESNNEG